MNTMRPSLLLLSSVMALVLLCGCERKISNANLRVIKADMTTKEVESILGVPTHVEPAPELVSHEVKTLPVTRYVYEQNGEKVELVFVGDRLSSGSSLSGTNAAMIKGHVNKNDIPAITGTFSK